MAIELANKTKLPIPAAFRDVIIAKKEGTVIGKNIRPNCEAGTRILHLGVDIKKPLPETIPGHKGFTPI